MKSGFFIFIFSICLLSACEKSGTGTEQELDAIVFSISDVQVDIDSRSGPVNQLPDGSSFGVFGYCLAQIAPDNTELNNSSGSLYWDQKKILCRPHLFYKQEVTYSGGACSYSPVKNWYDQVNYQYSFFAYYPYGDEYFSFNTDESTLGAPEVVFSIPDISTGESLNIEYENENGSSVTESYSVLDDALVPDAMVAQTIDVTRAGGVASLDFLHILTGLNFQVNNYNVMEDESGGQVPGNPVTIHSLVLAGDFYKSVEINFDSGYDFTDDTFNGAYVLVSQDIEVGGLESVSGIGGKTLLMVSNLTKTSGEDAYIGNLKLAVTYSFGDTVRRTKVFSRPDNFLPAGGTIYTAQLNFIGNSFVLNFIVDNDSKWEDGGDSDITFE